MIKKKGYTLIELLVALGIIVILATFLLASYSRSQAKARDARRKADIGTIGVSLESYFNDHNTYPTENEIVFGSPFETYMSKLPQDPDPNKAYCYTPSDDLLSYTLGADFETTGGVRCTALGATPSPTLQPLPPSPTVMPTPTLLPTMIPTFTPTPTETPSGQCYGGHWRQIGGPGLCAGLGDLTTEGQQVDGGCDAWICGSIIENCNYQDNSCPIFTEPPTHPYFGQGRRYTTCQCRL